MFHFTFGYGCSKITYSCMDGHVAVTTVQVLRNMIADQEKNDSRAIKVLVTTRKATGVSGWKIHHAPISRSFLQTVALLVNGRERSRERQHNQQYISDAQWEAK